jgi:hypothetical protein
MNTAQKIVNIIAAGLALIVIAGSVASVVLLPLLPVWLMIIGIQWGVATLIVRAVRRTRV